MDYPRPQQSPLNTPPHAPEVWRMDQKSTCIILQLVLTLGTILSSISLRYLLVLLLLLFQAAVIFYLFLWISSMLLIIREFATLLWSLSFCTACGARFRRHNVKLSSHTLTLKSEC